jgi:BolA family transcriptional regulator, general stress-responsive regulator
MTGKPTVDRARWLEATLRDSLQPEHLEIEDESDLHSGHLGAVGGGAHFRVIIVSSRFQGHGRIARQRMVYAALGNAMGTDIHALALRTLTPQEWRAAETAQPGG